MADIFKRLAAMLFGLLIAWGMVEVFLRVGYDFIPRDAQSIIQHVRRVPWNEERLVPPFPYVLSREHQAMVAPNHADYPVKWGDAKFTFDTIALWDMPVGFRTNPPEWPVEIVALGDSFTFCWTDFEDCWVQKLHSDYGWSVMNLGEPGTGTAAHQSLIEPYVKPLEPEVIVWQWYGNDFKDDYDLDRMQGVVQALPEPPQPTTANDYGTFAEYSAVYRLFRDWLYKQENPPDEHGFVTTVDNRQIFFTDELNAFDFGYPSVEHGWQRGIAALLEAHEIAKNELSAEIVIVLIPTKEEVYTPEKLSSEFLADMGEGRTRLLSVCEENGWHCLDLLPVFQAAVQDGETVYHAFDFHLDATGNAILAEQLAAYLTENELLERELP